MISYTEAAAVVAGEAERFAHEPRACETVPLLDALGRVPAEPVPADRDQPPFARSTRDGFAARAGDWARGALPVAGLLKAGERWDAELAEGTCLEIMTGAPVPAGADSVAMVEHTEREGDTVRLGAGRRLLPGENVVPAGAEARAGAVLLPAGTRLNAHGVAVAASCGYAELRVFRRPRVAILSTGDELVGVGDTPLPQQIRNSNSYTLASQVLALGGEPRLLPPAADTAEALDRAIGEAMEGADLLLLSGGVSMGRYDLVEPALARLGGRFLFTGVRMQPGKPVVFGSLHEGRLPFFGLPGNPVSTIVCFALFAAPVVAALGGERGYRPRFVQARLRGHLAAKPGLPRVLPARVTHAVEGAPGEVLAWQGSGDLASTARANGFAVAPDSPEPLQDGTAVTVLLS